MDVELRYWPHHKFYVQRQNTLKGIWLQFISQIVAKIKAPPVREGLSWVVRRLHPNANIGFDRQ